MVVLLIQDDIDSSLLLTTIFITLFISSLFSISSSHDIPIHERITTEAGKI
jgi:hypothetical protein